MFIVPAYYFPQAVTTRSGITHRTQGHDINRHLKNNLRIWHGEAMDERPRVGSVW